MTKRTQAETIAAALEAVRDQLPAKAAEPHPNTTVPAYDRTALAKHEAYWAAGITELRELPCDTLDQEAWFAGLLNEAQQLFKRLDAERVAYVDPMNQEVKAANAAFKPTLAALEEAKALIAGKLSAAATARGRAAAGLREQAALAAQAGDVEGCQLALAGIAEDVKVDGIATLWSWKVVSIDAAQVPDAFKVVDEKLLKAVCKAFKDKEVAPAVAGVVFERTADVQPRGAAK